MSIFNSTLHDGLAEANILPMLDSGEDRFLSAHKTFDLNPYIVIGLVLLVGDVEELSQAFVLEHLDPFSCLKKECSIQISHLYKRMDTTSDL